MITYALVTQATSTHAESALSIDGVISASILIPKSEISKRLADALHQLYQQIPSGHSLSYLAVSRGPAPFSSLRSVIATVNGFAFGFKVPVVAIDGLELCASEIGLAEGKNTVLVLNAYHKQLYYAFYTGFVETARGCADYDEIVQKIKNVFGLETFYIFGSGAELCWELLRNEFKAQMHAGNINVTNATLDFLVQQSFLLFQKQIMCQWARPLYLKEGVYKQSIIQPV